MPRKIDKAELNRMLRDGITQREAAKYFGVTESAVSIAKKTLKNTIIRTVAMEKANEVVEADLDMMAQLRKVNKAINEELDQAKEEIVNSKSADKRSLQEIIIKLSAEVRKQLETGLRIAEVWYDHKVFAEFREEVLNTLEEMAPGTRDAIIRRLKEKRAIRGLVSIDR
jgi:hypothetical protein